MANGFTNHMTLWLLEPGRDTFQHGNCGFIQSKCHLNHTKPHYDTAADQESTSAKRRSSNKPKSEFLVSFAFVNAGLFRPHRNRAACRGSASASGWDFRNERNPETLSCAGSAGRATGSGKDCGRPLLHHVQ